MKVVIDRGMDHSDDEVVLRRAAAGDNAWPLRWIAYVPGRAHGADLPAALAFMKRGAIRQVERTRAKLRKREQRLEDTENI